MNILQLLASSSFITLNKNVIKAVGLEEALILGELSSEYDYWLKRDELNNGWFFSTVENIEKNTTLNDYKQRKAIDNLVKLNILETDLKGIPAKRYFKINEEQVVKLLDIQFLNGLNSSSQIFKELDVKNLKTNNNINNNNINNNNIVNDELQETWDAYVDMRKKIKKPMTEYAKKLALKKLDELSNGDVDVKIKILNQSIVNSWQGLFPLKEEKCKPQYPQQKQYGREDTSFSIELAEQKARAFSRGEIDICGKRR